MGAWKLGVHLAKDAQNVVAPIKKRGVLRAKGTTTCAGRGLSLKTVQDAERTRDCTAMVSATNAC
jgi:hypothetical protein